MPPYIGFREYDELPVAVRCRYTREEYAWMPDAQKHSLIETDTMPDFDAEDAAYDD